MDGLVEGRIVHLVTSEREGARHSAAIVAAFTASGQTYSALDVPYSATPAPKTWHWVERE